VEEVNLAEGGAAEPAAAVVDEEAQDAAQDIEMADDSDNIKDSGTDSHDGSENSGSQSE
jgi:hypothetical protein